MNSLISVFAAALLLAPQHPSMPKGMSHEEHLKQMKKDEALKKRGAEAMGFESGGHRSPFPSVTLRGIHHRRRAASR